MKKLIKLFVVIFIHPRTVRWERGRSRTRPFCAVESKSCPGLRLRGTGDLPISIIVFHAWVENVRAARQIGAGAIRNPARNEGGFVGRRRRSTPKSEPSLDLQGQVMQRMPLLLLGPQIRCPQPALRRRHQDAATRFAISCPSRSIAVAILPDSLVSWFDFIYLFTMTWKRWFFWCFLLVKEPKKKELMMQANDGKPSNWFCLNKGSNSRDSFDIHLIWESAWWIVNLSFYLDL